MSPRPADPAIRAALIDAAARLLATGGTDALTTRALASAVGTSTMAVYTYFAGMAELRHEVRKEGFARLAGYLEAVGTTEDPVADVAALGGAYISNALANPHLYRFMFVEPPIDDDPHVGMGTFERIVDAVGAAVASGRFAKADPVQLATQLWVMVHGLVTLHLAGLLTLDEVLRTSGDMAINLFAAFGDERPRAVASMERARAMYGVPPANAHV